jgi:hypothetical protein
MVPVDRSRNEIERTLLRFGAEGFGYAWEGSMEAVHFVYRGKQVRLRVPMPNSASYTTDRAREQERRRRWRVLAMSVKATVVAVDEGLIQFEEAFLAWFVLPSGHTLGEALVPRLEAAAREGQLPTLALPSPDRTLEGPGDN